MQYQLRIYTMKPDEMTEWLREWKEKVRPLRERFGFTVVGAWTSEENNRFVWILRHDGPEPWDEADRRYYGSRERAELRPDPARHIAHSEVWLMAAALD